MEMTKMPILKTLIAAHSLIPWKLDTPFSTHPPSAFANHVNGLCLNLEVDNTLLDLGATLRAYFTDPLASKVHIIIQLPLEHSFIEGGSVWQDLPQVKARAIEHNTYNDLVAYLLGASWYILDALSSICKKKLVY